MNKGPASPVDPLEVRLVDAAAGGDLGARRDLFDRFREDAYRVALRLTRRHEDALDVVQDSFIRAFAGLDSFSRESRFKTWLLRIVNNRALDLLRARKVRIAASLDSGGGENNDGPLAVEDSETPDPGLTLERSETQARLEAAMERLPIEQRTVMAMYAVQELTYAEIAESLGIPIGTVMSRLYHARRKLAEMLPDLAR